MKWDDIFTHETFLNAWENVDVDYTPKRLELIKSTYAHCRPGQEAPRELIEAAEKMRADHAYLRMEEKLDKAEAAIARYDKFFGPGAYEQKFGAWDREAEGALYYAS